MFIASIVSIFFAVAIENIGPRIELLSREAEGISGATYVANREYLVVRDKVSRDKVGCSLHRLSFATDNSEPKLSIATRLRDSRDLEGIAFDPIARTIWVADEADASVREYDIASGNRTGRFVAIPKKIRASCRPNFVFEGLSISPCGKTLWVANEESLTCDGAPSVPGKGSVVRLMKFSRSRGEDNWQLDGMWAYECDGVGAAVPVCSGVSALCALEDGSLLVLERESSYETFGRARIYRPNFSLATNVAKIGSLAKCDFIPVAKGKCLYEVFDGAAASDSESSATIACYEGLALGSRLEDGSRELLLISDGGGYFEKRVGVFRASARAKTFMRRLRLQID